MCYSNYLSIKYTDFVPIAASSLALAWGAAVLKIKFLTSEILKITSSGIPSRPPRKLYTEFQLEFWEIQLEAMEKELDQKNVMTEIQQIVMDAVAKDDAAIVYHVSLWNRTSPKHLNSSFLNETSLG